MTSSEARSCREAWGGARAVCLAGPTCYTSAPMAKGSRVTRHAVVTPPDPQAIENSAKFKFQLLRYIGWGCLLLIVCVPLQIIREIVSDLAGKDTRVTIGLVCTMSVLGVAAIIKAWFSGKKSREQSEELVRLRERVKVLEEGRPQQVVKRTKGDA